MAFMDEVRGRIKGRGSRVVYPEGLEERALRAAALLRDRTWSGRCCWVLFQR